MVSRTVTPAKPEPPALTEGGAGIDGTYPYEPDHYVRAGLDMLKGLGGYVSVAVGLGEQVGPPVEPCTICGDPTPGGGTCANCQAW